MEIFAYLHPYLHPRKMAEIRHLMEIMEIMEISTSLNEIKTHPIIYYIEGVMSFYLHIPIIRNRGKTVGTAASQAGRNRPLT